MLVVKPNVSRLADGRILDTSGISFDVPVLQVSRDMLREFAEEGCLEYSKQFLDDAKYVVVRGQACFGWACAGVYLEDWCDQWFGSERDFDAWMEFVNVYPIHDLHDLFWGSKSMGCEYEVWHVVDGDPDWMPRCYVEFDGVDIEFAAYMYGGKYDSPEFDYSGYHFIAGADTLTDLLSYIYDCVDFTMGVRFDMDDAQRICDPWGEYVLVKAYLYDYGNLPFRTAKGFQLANLNADGTINDKEYIHHRNSVAYYYKYNLRNMTPEQFNFRVLNVFHESKRLFPKMPVIQAKDHYVGETFK